jgi:uncharacterized protein YciI
MPPITDDQMRELLTRAQAYTLVLLHSTDARDRDGADAIVWEHGRRNLELREQGVLAIVCPVADDSGVAGVGIFAATPEETAEIMDGDPGVQAGIFTYEVHPVRGFPGDALPG